MASRPGETVTVSLLINDVPYGGTGTYTLKFDIYDPVSLIPGSAKVIVNPSRPSDPPMM